jgi:hypothetical protein
MRQVGEMVGMGSKAGTSWIMKKLVILLSFEYGFILKT